MTFKEEVFVFIKELSEFEYMLESMDKRRDILFSDSEDKWNWVRVTQYRQTFFLFHVDGDLNGIEVVPGKSLGFMENNLFSGRSGAHETTTESRWHPLIKSMRTWLNNVRKDWIKANKRVWSNYPLNRRSGIILNSLVRESIPDLYKINEAIGHKKCKEFIDLVEKGYFFREENYLRQEMSAKDYFEYCRIAYIAGKRKDEKIDRNLNGREMYEKYADGRHEGLLDIDENSPEEFSDWMDGKHPKRTTGGHPWEIKRGGNTTHIDLAVYRPRFKNEGFIVALHGESIGRLAETIKMFLSIHKASLPITIDDPEGIRMRLLGQDNIGIVPQFENLHRGNQRFSKEKKVYDVLHYGDLGRYKKRLTPFITWDPLPVLKPRDF